MLTIYIIEVILLTEISFCSEISKSVPSSKLDDSMPSQPGLSQPLDGRFVPES